MEDLFQTALGITSPWYIESLTFDVENSRLDVFINFQRGATFKDPEDPSGKEYKAYDTVRKQWRHMNFFQHECYLHARVPRIDWGDNKPRLISPPWSGRLSGFTLLFEVFLIQLPMGLLAFGVLIEICQKMTGYRHFSVNDILADEVGILGYLRLYMAYKGSI